ncbi:unnamed protein product [Cuscuta epithymum]|uniref:Cyclin-like domain-containing protein n=1 Tax=Cuscuta epithymum TaxID=186058 RepID=A0AAV0FGA0_9ASTE|nr:unnamed protein product [Cuscuta epithymum]
MAADPSHHGLYDAGTQENAEEGGGSWYFSRREIEENSPSRHDGIDLKKETYLRKSYCTFLQDLGMRLKVPQVTIATAIIFCHRFFLRQSHAKNDRRNIATVCMFLAGKVEETPRPLKDVILVSYEVIHKKDPAAIQRIKQKEVYEQQKELILVGERVVLATLGFDLNLLHPYKPLVEAIKKFKVAQNALAQVAWNFVNDGLRTSLCLQFKPHHIAAGAIFLAAKFLKVKLPHDGEKVWWQEFDVTPRQLEEVSNQMLELYEQNKAPPPSHASEAEESAAVAAAGGTQRPTGSSVANEENNNISYGGSAKTGTSIASSSHRPIPDHLHADNHVRGGGQNHINDYESSEKSILERRGDDGGKSSDKRNHEREPPLPYHGEDELVEGNAAVIASSSKLHNGRALEHKDVTTVVQSPQEVIIKKIDKDKVKAALERNRKSRGDAARKVDVLDDDDLIERELEDGIELAAEAEKSKRERRQSWSKPSNRPDHDNTMKHHQETSTGNRHYDHHHHQEMKGEGQSLENDEDYKNNNNVEEGELEPYIGDDDADKGGYQSPKSVNRKRKASSPLEEGKQRHEYMSSATHNHTYHDFPDDRNRSGRLGGYSERDHKRHPQENHV